ncbi:hypothetical protein M569_17103 [Genlisea aurea]|uniref:Uncharacterized protein n=1 Tax=Genlisea aurea TaxID=192259 RepID=S8BTJ8_9LAMI|nr:hypothetical protein M569_17103 [Genlisea aurea]
MEGETLPISENAKADETVLQIGATDEAEPMQVITSAAPESQMATPEPHTSTSKLQPELGRGKRLDVQPVLQVSLYIP